MTSEQAKKRPGSVVRLTPDGTLQEAHIMSAILLMHNNGISYGAHKDGLRWLLGDVHTTPEGSREPGDAKFEYIRSQPGWRRILRQFRVAERRARHAHVRLLKIARRALIGLNGPAAKRRTLDMYVLTVYRASPELFVDTLVRSRLLDELLLVTAVWKDANPEDIGYLNATYRGALSGRCPRIKSNRLVTRIKNRLCSGSNPAAESKSFADSSRRMGSDHEYQRIRPSVDLVFRGGQRFDDADVFMELKEGMLALLARQSTTGGFLPEHRALARHDARLVSLTLGRWVQSVVNQLMPHRFRPRVLSAPQVRRVGEDMQSRAGAYRAAVFVDWYSFALEHPMLTIPTSKSWCPGRYNYSYDHDEEDQTRLELCQVAIHRVSGRLDKYWLGSSLADDRDIYHYLRVYGTPLNYGHVWYCRHINPPWSYGSTLPHIDMEDRIMVDDMNADCLRKLVVQCYRRMRQASSSRSDLTQLVRFDMVPYRR